MAASCCLLLGACGADDVASERNGTTQQLPPQADAADTVSTALADLGPALFHAVVADRPGNVAIAPWPVADSLAQVRAGAVGETRDGLSSALALGGTEDLVTLRGLGTLEVDLQSHTGEQGNDERRGTVSIESATGLWIQRGTLLDAPWLDDLSSGLGRGVHLVDFRSDPESSRQAINAWASEETGGAIDQLVLRGVATADTRLIAATALWLQAPWAQSFEVARTTPSPFTRLDDTLVDVPMMRLEAPRLRSTTSAELDAVELPYLGGDLAMLVIIPATGRYADVESSLDATRLSTLIDDLRAQPTTVRLPRFGFTTELRLDDAVTTLGAGRALSTDDAELDRMAPDDPLAVSSVVQQVFFSVDEEGSQASAATVAGEPEPTITDAVDVAADRPFLFVVFDRRTETNLMLGRVLDPST